MPNWCFNNLSIKGPKEDLQRFKKAAIGANPWLPNEKIIHALNFHSLQPIPDGVLAQGYDTAGYDWEVQHWGCKWGAIDSVDTSKSERKLCYEFATAWTPPIEFLYAIAPRWPSLRFSLKYEEPMEGFRGKLDVPESGKG